MSRICIIVEEREVNRWGKDGGCWERGRGGETGIIGILGGKENGPECRDGHPPALTTSGIRLGKSGMTRLYGPSHRGPHAIPLG